MNKEPDDTTPDLIVIGRDEQGKPRAARFPAKQTNVAAKAAKPMNLTVCTAEGAALAELVKKLPMGRVYASVFAPPVERKLYVEVVEHLNVTGQLVAGEIDDSDEQPAQYFPATWDDISVGHLVNRARERVCGLVGGHRPRPGRRHADLEMA